jgi:hypothetical protein
VVLPCLTDTSEGWRERIYARGERIRSQECGWFSLYAPIYPVIRAAAVAAFPQRPDLHMVPLQHSHERFTKTVRPGTGHRREAWRKVQLSRLCRKRRRNSGLPATGST